MSLVEFNTTIAPIINLLFSGTAIVSLILLFYQIRQTNKWNRLHSKYNFIDTQHSSDLEKNMREATQFVDVKLTGRHFESLKEEEIEKLRSNHDVTFAINRFLNDMQNLCAALNYGILEKKVFEAIHSGRVLWWYIILLPYIEKCKIWYNDPKLWQDFVSVGKELATRKSGNRDTTN